jgi:hypothetical protein
MKNCRDGSSSPDEDDAAEWWRVDAGRVAWNARLASFFR